MVVPGGRRCCGVAASDAFGLGVQVVRGRWFMVFASFLIMSAAGHTFIFGIYSKDIKSSLGYNQQTLNTLSFFKDLGGNLGILSGFINEVSPPWVVLTIGAAMSLSGYLMVYLAITARISRPHVWQMCLYICIGSTSSAFANTGALVTCVKNFPESRGIVLGLLKGFLGLSGAVFTQLYLAFYGDDSKSLVLLTAWLPAAVSIVFAHTIRIMKVVRHPNELKVFYSFLYISLTLAGYLMVMIIVQKRVIFSHPEYSTSATIILLLLFLPLALVIREEFILWKQKNQLLIDPPPISITVEKQTAPKPEERLMASPTSSVPSTRSSEKKSVLVLSCIMDIFKKPERGEDYSILQALVSVDMLILFFLTMCGAGGTLTAIDNMGQIGESLGYTSRSIGTFISLFSIWNYLGRVTAGFASEIFLAKYRFPRPLMLTLVLLLSCIGHMLIAFGIPGSLYVASVIIGFSVGALWPLLFAIISEVFGLKYYSTLFNLGGFGSPIGSYVLNVRVAGHLYDREAAKQNAKLSGTSAKGLTCTGVQCFRLSFFIITAVTVLGALVSLVLVWRTWEFYKGDIYARFREAGEAEKGTAVTNASAGKEEGEERPYSRRVGSIQKEEKKRTEKETK